MSGEESASLPCLQQFIAELRFGYSSERLVEGGHATVHLRTQGARNRTEAYDSLSLRLPELRRQLCDSPAFFKEFLTSVQRVRTPTQAIQTLGLSDHPSMALARDAWDPIHRKITYRSDAHSQFHSWTEVQHCHYVNSCAPPADSCTDHIPPAQLVEAGSAGQMVQTTCEGKYGDIVKEAAVRFLGHKVASEQGHWVYSVRVHADSCSTLLSLLAPSAAMAEVGDSVAARSEATPATDVPGALQPQGVPEMMSAVTIPSTGALFFSVISADPLRSKRADPGSLARGDLGVCMHKVMFAQRAPHRIIVSSTPASLDSAILKELRVPLCAMVMSTRVLPLSVLEKLLRWSASSELTLELSRRVGPESLESNPSLAAGLASMTELLHALVSAPGGKYSVDPNDENRDSFMAVLQEMAAAGVVSCRHQLGQEQEWSLTEAGCAAVRAGVTLTRPTAVMCPRNVPPAEMMLYELIKSLELEKWQCNMACTRKQVREARDAPYNINVEGSPRVWWIKATDEFRHLSRDYLILLLTANTHQEPIPHFAATASYKARAWKRIVDFKLLRLCFKLQAD